MERFLPNSSKTFSLNHKFMFFSMIILICVSISVMLILSMLAVWKHNDYLNALGESKARMVAISIQEDFLEKNLEELQFKLKKLIDNDLGIQRLSIYDENNNRIVSYSKHNNNVNTSHEYLSSNVYKENLKNGFILLSLEKTSFLSSINELNKTEKIIAFLMILIPGLIMIFLINRLMLAPIAKVINAFDYQLTKNKKHQSNTIEINKLKESLRFLNKTLSDNQKKQQELRQAKHRLTNVLDAVGEAIITIDQKGNIQMTNKSTEKIFGYPSVRLMEMNLVELMPDKYRDAHKKGMERYLNTKEAHVLNTRIEIEAQRKGGHVFPIDLHITETMINGELFFTAAIRDITERKKSEKEVADAKNSIEILLDKKTKELKEAQLLLMHAEKMETIGTLSAGVAHEVKNPLAIIQLGIDYMRQNAISPSIKDVIIEMEAAIQRADKVIKQLLNFSAEKELLLEEYNPNNIIHDSLSMVNHELVTRKININLNLEETIKNIKCDKAKLEQILINIFMNSIQAIEENGEIFINTFLSTAENYDTEVTFENYNPNTDIVVISIEDTGGGIPEEQLDAVAEPFFSTKHSDHGTGLGLTVVDNLIRLHSAKINYKNKGKGLQTILLFNAF